MKKYRIIVALCVLVGVAVLGMGLTSLIASPACGSVVPDSVASTLRGSCCCKCSLTNCQTKGDCDATNVWTSDADGQLITLDTNGSCGSLSGCATYWVEASTCSG